VGSFQSLPEKKKRALCPRPEPRLWGWRTWSLLLPSVASAIGLFAFAVLAYSFTELRTLPAQFRRNLVLTGAFALAFGDEIGTLTTAVEIFRKHGNGQARFWDWAGLGVSVLATLAAFLLAFAALLGASASWSEPVRAWGAIALGVCAALDSYVNFAELGLYLATHDARHREWDTYYLRWLEWAARGYGWAAREPTQPAQASAQDTGPLPELPQDAPQFSGNGKGTPYRYCELCGFTAYSPQAWAGHCRGKEHKRRIAQAAAQEAAR
jgi:hypothetical protein